MQPSSTTNYTAPVNNTTTTTTTTNSVGGANSGGFGNSTTTTTNSNDDNRNLSTTTTTTDNSRHVINNSQPVQPSQNPVNVQITIQRRRNAPGPMLPVAPPAGVNGGAPAPIPPVLNSNNNSDIRGNNDEATFDDKDNISGQGSGSGSGQGIDSDPNEKKGNNEKSKPGAAQKLTKHKIDLKDKKIGIKEGKSLIKQSKFKLKRVNKDKSNSSRSSKACKTSFTPLKSRGRPKN